MIERSTGPADVGGTLHERVTTWLRNAILSGQLKPGARIVQADIAARLKVSLTPVREAMRDLHTEGLLQLSPRRGGTVRGLQLQDVQEMRMLCSLLEPRCAALVAERIEPQELRNAWKMQSRLERISDFPTYFKANRDFHYFLYGTARSPHLEKLLRGIHDATSAYLPAAFSRTKDRFANGLREHRQFLDACDQKKPKKAAEIMRLHWDIVFAEVELIAIEQATLSQIDLSLS